jgi:hypothetical protein
MQAGECVYDTDWRNGFCFDVIKKIAYNEFKKTNTPFVNDLSTLKDNAEKEGYSKIDLKPRGPYVYYVLNSLWRQPANTKINLTKEFVCSGIDKKQIYLNRCFCSFKPDMSGSQPSAIQFGCYYFKKRNSKPNSALEKPWSKSSGYLDITLCKKDVDKSLNSKHEVKDVSNTNKGCKKNNNGVFYFEFKFL